MVVNGRAALALVLTMTMNCPVVGAVADDSMEELDRARQTGDMSVQRAHLWRVFLKIVAMDTEQGVPAFERWHGEEEVFSPRFVAYSLLGTHALSHPTFAAKPKAKASQSPLLTNSLYNQPAFDHIRRWRLSSARELENLRVASLTQPRSGTSEVPAFPPDSIVLKAVWWPVAHDQPATMPVWDPESNPPRQGGNGYMTWIRTVVVNPLPVGAAILSGAYGSTPTKVPLDQFYQVDVDSDLAQRIMRDPDGRKVAAIALGRAIQPGDHLALVAINLATRELKNWIWGAFWWHDRPNVGEFGRDRPGEVKGRWANYLMSVSFDSKRPVEPTGAPHVAFNPWLEGRFPDGGEGGGTVSNCLTCHSRAGYPARDFLPITRDMAPQVPAAISPGDADTLHTSLLWGLPMHASQ